MKTIQRISFLLLVSFLFAACSTDDNSDTDFEEVKELKLSANGDILTEGETIYTEDVDFEFEILQGNGDYTISLSNDESAKFSIEENKVSVNLLKSHVNITISDKKEQTTLINIVSTAESLVSNGYGILIEEGRTHSMSVNFGAGGYIVEKIKGESSTVVVTEDDEVKVTGLKPGNSYYKIKDKRGSTAPLEVLVPSYYDLTDNKVEITAINDQTISIVLKWGEGDWQLVEPQTSSPIIEQVFLMPKGDEEKKYDILQIDTSKDDIKGIATIDLKDSLGNKAHVTVKIE